MAPPKELLPYGNSSGFVPRKPEDFGDGGAFPEIHVAQYPLGVGHKDQKPGSKILASTGKVAFDVIVKQNVNTSKIVYSQRNDLARKEHSERTKMAPALGAPLSADKSMIDDMRVEQHETMKETREEWEQRMEREKLREERWAERERRLEARDAAMGKKSETTRDRDRDISEKVALGMANTGARRTGEVMYDQRLFYQDKGVDSGHVADDHCNIYDRGLFTARPILSTIHSPEKDADTDMYGGADEQLEKVLKTDRFEPDKASTGASERPSGSKRGKPVQVLEFDTQDEDELFSFEAVLERVERKKKAMDKIGEGETSILISGRHGSYIGRYLLKDI